MCAGELRLLSGILFSSKLRSPSSEAAVARAGVGLCTSNLRAVVDATLHSRNLAFAFGGGTTVQEDVLDAQGQPRMKPERDPYRRALRLLARPARSVVAVEDSVVRGLKP